MISGREVGLSVLKVRSIIETLGLGMLACAGKFESRNVDLRGDSDRDTGHISFQLGQHGCDGLGSAGGSRNNIIENTTSYEGLEIACLLMERDRLPRRAFFLLYPSRTC